VALSGSEPTEWLACSELLLVDWETELVENGWLRWRPDHEVRNEVLFLLV
jgi:hypothetical protein